MQKKREYSHDLTPTYFLKDAKEKMWTQINPEMYTLFWLFTLDDIFLPKARYDAEIEKLNKEILKLEESKTSEAQANSSKTAKSKIDKVKQKIIK